MYLLLFIAHWFPSRQQLSTWYARVRRTRTRFVAFLHRRRWSFDRENEIRRGCEAFFTHRHRIASSRFAVCILFAHGLARIRVRTEWVEDESMQTIAHLIRGFCSLILLAIISRPDSQHPLLDQVGQPVPFSEPSPYDHHWIHRCRCLQLGFASLCFNSWAIGSRQWRNLESLRICPIGTRSRTKVGTTDQWDDRIVAKHGSCSPRAGSELSGWQSDRCKIVTNHPRQIKNIEIPRHRPCGEDWEFSSGSQRPCPGRGNQAIEIDLDPFDESILSHI